MDKSIVCGFFGPPCILEEESLRCQEPCDFFDFQNGCQALIHINDDKTYRPTLQRITSFFLVLQLAGWNYNIWLIFPFYNPFLHALKSKLQLMFSFYHNANVNFMWITG